MKLEILRNKEIKPRTMIILGIIVISLIGMIIYQSYALFKTNETHKIVDGEVGTFSTGDIKILSVYVDGEKVSSFPSKTDGKVYEKIECTNSGIGSFDSVNWKLTVSGITEPTSCNVYFISSTTQTVISGNIYVDYDENMIPVAYNASGVTVKADITNTDANYKWFDYSTSGRRWANAILVTDASRETYKNAPVGTAIAENDILAYLVYIPRYRYQLFNASNSTVSARAISVAFENKTTPKSNGSTNGTWLTHPAFTFGTSELNGIWVGKFENSPEESSSCYASSGCNLTNIMPRIKPNKKSWKYINVSNMFITNQYFKTNLIYGINNSSIDSHMMKNMEWGAVAYLTQSQYGKNSGVYTGVALTGCSEGSMNANGGSTCSYPYPDMTVNGVGASTTGTIYGIYDMSGGAHDVVMGNMVDNNGSFQPSSSGFASAWGANNNGKYYDSYTYGTTTYDVAAFARGKLGDATRETVTCTSDFGCGWYGGMSLFLRFTDAWFIRGGLNAAGGRTSVFAFNFATGAADAYSTSRAVLVVE